MKILGTLPPRTSFHFIALNGRKPKPYGSGLFPDGVYYNPKMVISPGSGCGGQMASAEKGSLKGPPVLGRPWALVRKQVFVPQHPLQGALTETCLIYFLLEGKRSSVCLGGIEPVSRRQNVRSLTTKPPGNSWVVSILKHQMSQPGAVKCATEMGPQGGGASDPRGPAGDLTLMIFFSAAGVWVASDLRCFGVSPLLRGVLGGKFSSNNSGLRRPPKETRLLFGGAPSVFSGIRDTGMRKVMKAAAEVRLVPTYRWRRTDCKFAATGPQNLRFHGMLMELQGLLKEPRRTPKHQVPTQQDRTLRLTKPVWTELRQGCGLKQWPPLWSRGCRSSRSLRKLCQSHAQASPRPARGAEPTSWKLLPVIVTDGQLYLFICLFRAAFVAYGASQARGHIRAVATDLHTPPPQPHGIRAASATYTTPHGNVRSLTH